LYHWVDVVQALSSALSAGVESSERSEVDVTEADNAVANAPDNQVFRMTDLVKAAFGP
jgi:hypothetical protein